MKTAEQYKAAVADIRRVCEAHGVVLIPTTRSRGGNQIELHDADDLVKKLAQVKDLHGRVKPYNEVQYYPEQIGAHGTDHERFSTVGIGDVEGVIPGRITVHRHSTAISDMNVSVTVDVTSLDEVESLEFVKEFRSSRFERFAIGLGDGPFGTLIAEFNGHASMVVGFIEGPKPEELLKKWPAKRGTQDGNH